MLEVDEIMERVISAPEADRRKVARELLKQYKGADKSSVEAWISEMLVTQEVIELGEISA